MSFLFGRLRFGLEDCLEDLATFERICACLIRLLSFFEEGKRESSWELLGFEVLRIDLEGLDGGVGAWEVYQ